MGESFAVPGNKGSHFRGSVEARWPGPEVPLCARYIQCSLFRCLMIDSNQETQNSEKYAPLAGIQPLPLRTTCTYTYLRQRETHHVPLWPPRYGRALGHLATQRPPSLLCTQSKHSSSLNPAQPTHCSWHARHPESAGNSLALQPDFGGGRPAGRGLTLIIGMACVVVALALIVTSEHMTQYVSKRGDYVKD